MFFWSTYIWGIGGGIFLNLGVASTKALRQELVLLCFRNSRIRWFSRVGEGEEYEDRLKGNGGGADPAMSSRSVQGISAFTLSTRKSPGGISSSDFPFKGIPLTFMLRRDFRGESKSQGVT